MKKMYTALVALGLALGANAQVPTSGLINRWNFDDNITNAVAGGVQLDTSTFGSAAKFGKDRFGNPSGAYFSTYGNGPTIGGVGTSTNIPQGTSQFTISFWCYSRINDDALWLSFGGSAVDSGFRIRTIGSTIQTNQNNSAAAQNAFATINGARWKHIIVSYDGSEIQIYENLSLINSFTKVLKTNGLNFQVFAEQNGANNTDSERLIDELFMYNRILTNTEKTQLGTVGANCNNYYLFLREVTNASSPTAKDGRALFSASSPSYPMVANLEVAGGGITQISFPDANNFWIDSLYGNSTYTLDLTGGCSEAKTFIVGVNPPPPCAIDMVATTNVTNATSTNPCNGSVIFDVDFSAGGQPIGFAGSLEVKHLQGTTTFTTFANMPDSIGMLCAGTYKVILTPKDKNGNPIGCAIDTVTFTIGGSSGCITPLVPTITRSGDTLFANSTGVTGGYDWYKDGGVIATTTALINYIIVTANGSYTVRAGNGNCVTTPSTAFAVTNFPTSIANVASEVGLNIYPNPTKNTLSLVANTLMENISVMNILGEKVLTTTLAEKAKTLDVSGFSAGVYFVQIRFESGIATKQFIKE